jgi:rhodanese-related sulfurtransferase
MFMLNHANVNPVNAGATDEQGIINVLDNNSNEIIIDIRWYEVYKVAHLPGARLIDSSLPEETQHSQAITVLNQLNANYTTPIILLCNCPDGHFAKNMEDYLNSVGYTNTYHLKTTFSDWKNPAYLISGEEITGNAFLTSIPANLAGVGPSPLENPIFILGILAIGGAGLYFVMRNPNKIVSTSEIEDKVKKSDEKRKIQIQSLKDSLGTDIQTNENKPTKKQNIKRRH